MYRSKSINVEEEMKREGRLDSLDEEGGSKKECGGRSESIAQEWMKNS